MITGRFLLIEMCMDANPQLPSTSLLPRAEILRHVVDVHCHPTDSPIPTEYMESLPITICAMSTRPSDQDLVRDLATAYPEKVIPSFGQRCCIQSCGP